ncbi:peptide deformylase [candidate division KSB1 bacterium]|nr:peptide deformylase [candidate division KSB1 bacterium]
MPLIKIKIYGHPALRKICSPIETIDEETEQLAHDMVETMYENNGVGLAAPQVGVLKRLFIVNPREDDEDLNPQIFINPIIKNKSGFVTIEEGCLSIPDIRSDVIRCESFDFTSLNLKGEKIQFHADGLLARVILHEVDHLDGKLFIDYLSPVKKIMLNEKLKALEKESAVLSR